MVKHQFFVVMIWNHRIEIRCSSGCFRLQEISTRQPSKKARSTGIHLEQGTVKRPRHGLAHDRDCLACCSSILQSTCPGFQKKPVQVAEPDFDHQKFQKSVFQVPKKALQNAHQLIPTLSFPLTEKKGGV